MHQPRASRFLTLFSSRSHHSRLHIRTIFEGNLKPLRDRGLDHAVEREKNLKPILTLKNLIKREPSKSLPVSLLKRSSLSLPFRPIEFLRKYPSVFEEFLPTAAATAPHVRLTPKTLLLDADEHLLHQSDRFKHQAADKLLKLLMIARGHKIPLPLIQHLQWDLGLPEDYAQTLVPDFPDYFRIADGFLELVCWDDNLAVPAIQSRNKNKTFVGTDGFIHEPLEFSNGSETDKKYEKWLKEWQNLPYESPYENCSHLPSTSDESDVWVVGVLHEVLHVSVGKKIEKERLLEFGDWLGLRSRFKRALLLHPGIFYVSSKIGTYTVVLREGFKRGALIEDHPEMNLRNQYLHLMSSVREDGKTGKVVQGKGGVDKVEGKSVEGGEEGKEESEEEDASETDFEEEEEDDDEEESRRGSQRIATGRRGREFGKVKLDVDKPFRDSRREGSPLRDSRTEGLHLRGSQMERSPFRGSHREGSPLRGSRREGSPFRGSQREGSPLRDSQMEGSPFRGSHREGSPLSGSRREGSIGKTRENNSFEASERRQVRGAHNNVENMQERSRSSKPLRDSWRERSPSRGSRRERPIGRIGENNSFEVSKRRQVRGAHKDVETR